MKRKLIVSLIVLVIGIIAIILNGEKKFQLDADKARLEHLMYWSGLIEEYNQKTGHYPLQEMVSKVNGGPVLVRIQTAEQRSYTVKGGKNYNPNIDSNYDGGFKEVSVKDFVVEIESKLGHPIKEYYDIQKVPTGILLGYTYFATDKGYLLWGTCVTCGITPISTLLMDGVTPSINIGSQGMKKEVAKSLTHDEILNHPIFKDWQSRIFKKEEFVRARENETISDSKK